MYEVGEFPLLSLFTFAPTLGMIVILLLPSKRTDIIKTVASAAAAVPLLLGLYILFTYQDSGAIQYRESFLWINGLNVYYSLGIDGISAPMIVLSGLVGFVAVVSSWGVEKQVKGYFALILLLLTGMNGVFCALDFFLFYVFWELMLLPMYFLIGVWGGPNRIYAAIKFFLYTMAGGVLMLVVLLATWFWSDGRYEDNQALRNEYKQKLLQRRYKAWNDYRELGRIDMLTPKEKKTVLVRHGILWSKDPDAQLNEAALKYRQILGLPQKCKGDLDLIEQERANILSGVVLERTFDLLELKARYKLFLGQFSLFKFISPCKFATLMFVFLFIAFAIKVPIFPFHTWLPWAHVEAPTAVSVILAGILLKMGVYGFLRISYSLFPTEAINFAVPIAAMGVFNIIYGAFCALAQDDMKKLVAYSSVSHMGFCMLGMAALTQWGLTGAILQMFNHGTSTSMMFLLVGVIYDRAHHRDITKFGGLAKTLPVYTGVMTLALFASLGLPGLSGFISEILIFLGSFRSSMGEHSAPYWSFQTMTIIAATGVVLTAAYLLWMMQRVFFGPANEKYKGFKDLTGREIFTLAPLGVFVIAFGIYPQPLINLTSTTVKEFQSFVLQSRDDVTGATKTRIVENTKPTRPGEVKPQARYADSDSGDSIPKLKEAPKGPQKTSKLKSEGDLLTPSSGNSAGDVGMGKTVESLNTLIDDGPELAQTHASFAAPDLETK